VRELHRRNVHVDCEPDLVHRLEDLRGGTVHVDGRDGDDGPRLLGLHERLHEHE
jgi:hypothetical protein